MPLLAKRAKSEVVSLLDSWGGYEDRFYYKPDYVISLNEKTKNDIARIGVPHIKIFPLGNPSFDALGEGSLIRDKKIDHLNVCVFSDGTEQTKELVMKIIHYRNQHPNMIATINVVAKDESDRALGFAKVEDRIYTYPREYGRDVMKLSDIPIGINSPMLYEAELIGLSSVWYKGEAFREVIEEWRVAKYPDRKVTKGATLNVLHFIEEYFKNRN